MSTQKKNKTINLHEYGKVLGTQIAVMLALLMA